MRANLPVRILLAAAAASCAAVLPREASAQDAPPAPTSTVESPDARAERLRAAKERWARMSPEDREAMRRRFERWKALPPEKRQALRRRLEEMGGDAGAALVRSRLDDLRRRSPERMERMRRQGELVRRLEERLVESLPPEAAGRYAALAPEVRDRVRRRFARSLVALGRDAVLRRLATEEERAALAGSDPAARRAAVEALRGRVRDEVLASRREELASLPPAERRIREMRLVEERFWAGAEERLAEVRESFRRALEDPAPPNGRAPGGPREKIEEARERFQKTFGVAPDALGVRWAPMALHRHLRLLPAERREAFLEQARPELQRIAGLPAGEREAALRALLETLR